jgi:hypothetical protein
VNLKGMIAGVSGEPSKSSGIEEGISVLVVAARRRPRGSEGTPLGVRVRHGRPCRSGNSVPWQEAK